MAIRVREAHIARVNQYKLHASRTTSVTTWAWLQVAEKVRESYQIRDKKNNDIVKKDKQHCHLTKLNYRT